MIEVRNLHKNFDGHNALHGVNMTVPAGSIYGLVGVNGSGKTTVIKHLAGILRGDTGSCEIGGAPIHDNPEMKSKCAYVADDLYFFAGYNLKMLSKFYKNIYPNWDDERYAALIKMIGLDEKRRVGRFSKGMQKQAALALTLSTRPEYLLLDEPIDGLDPIVRKRVFDWIIGDVADRKMTVLISSHNLKEMDGICDTVGIIKGGKMLIERDLDDLKAEMATREISEHLPPTLDEIFIHVYEMDGDANA